MTSIVALAEELKKVTQWQRTPTVLTDADYADMILYGIRNLYIDTGRDGMYSDDMLIWSEDGKTVTDFNRDLRLIEREYVQTIAEIRFYEQVQTDVNNIVGYTTDALSVTNADKPYTHIAQTIGEKEKKRRRIFYKMTEYVM